MNILISINSNYLFPALAMLTSLLTNNSVKTNIYLLYNDLKDDEIDLLEKGIEKFDATIFRILVDNTQFINFPLSHHFSIETYFRFLAQSLLPSKVDRVLWLDADVIVNNSITDFYYQDLKGYYVSVCESINKEKNVLLKKLELPEDSNYFNAGVILFNLELIRKEIKPNVYFDYLINNKNKITWLDQDVLNVIFNKKIKYNDSDIFNFQIFSTTEDKPSDFKEKLNNASIIHYIGNVKPWHYKYQNNAYKNYWKYALIIMGKTPYIKFLILRKVYFYLWKAKRTLFN